MDALAQTGRRRKAIGRLTLAHISFRATVALRGPLSAPASSLLYHYTTSLDRNL